jgi:uncharacterized membrane protein
MLNNNLQKITSNGRGFKILDLIKIISALIIIIFALFVGGLSAIWAGSIAIAIPVYIVALILVFIIIRSIGDKR